MNDSVLSVLRAKFDAVLRKKTQKSSFDQSDNIVIRNNYHKKHKQNKAYGVDVALVFGIYGLAANRLYQEEEKSAAVERGQGKKICHADIYGYKRHYHKQAAEIF